MAYSAVQVDELITQFRRCARRQNASKSSDVRLRAAERDLLQVAETVRNLLHVAVTGDRGLLCEVFGGDCMRFFRLREAIDTVEFSAMHANDQRWKHLSSGMLTVEEVLKDLGSYRPPPARRESVAIKAARPSSPGCVYRLRGSSDFEDIHTELSFGLRHKAMLRYLGVRSIYFRGEALTLLPAVEGILKEWRVVPQLPLGLQLDQVSGIISGVPAVLVPESTWTVHARFAEDMLQADLTFSVREPAPSGLSYPGVHDELPIQQFLVLRPAVEGEVAEFSVTPELPAGLELDAATGIISGRADEVMHRLSYTVTAQNQSGAATALLRFSLVLAAPRAPKYPTAEDLYLLGELVTLQPTVAVSGMACWSVEPELPRGLEIDQETGCISGIPQELADEAAYVVTVTNEAGKTSTSLVFGVVAPRPEGLSYPLLCETYQVGEQMLVEPDLHSGRCLAFSVEPELPAGLQLDAETGIIFGVLKAAADLTSYQVRACNSAGSASTDLSFAVLLPLQPAEPEVTETADDTPVNQQFAQMVEEITDIAEMVSEPHASQRLGDWMLWMVHRAWLNDPSLTMVNFTGKHMPAPHCEPRIAPKLMKALAHNTHITSLQLANANVMKPQGHELAESLRVNTTLQVINIESNNLDSASIKHISEAMKENPGCALEQFRFSNQSNLGELFGRPVEKALAELVETHHRIVKLGFSCHDAHWRHAIDRALLKNNDLARRRRASCVNVAIDEEEVVPAQQRPLSRLVLAAVPPIPAEEVFAARDERLMLMRRYVGNLRRLPTKEQLQNFARGHGQPLPYSALSPVSKAYHAALLGAAVNCKVWAFDSYGAVFEGTLRSWSGKNEHWSVDLVQPDGTRIHFNSKKEPILEVSEAVASWQQPAE